MAATKVAVAQAAPPPPVPASLAAPAPAADHVQVTPPVQVAPPPAAVVARPPSEPPRAEVEAIGDAMLASGRETLVAMLRGGDQAQLGRALDIALHVSRKGQHIDQSQMVSSVPLNGPALLDFTVNGRGTRRPKGVSFQCSAGGYPTSWVAAVAFSGPQLAKAIFCAGGGYM